MRPQGAGTVVRVVGYARVSSAEQALGTSLQDQQNRIRAYAEARGLKIDRIYVEAESAIHEKLERREQVQALMGEARAGDLVLVDKVDRLSRDPEFTYRSVRELREKGARIYFVEEGIDPETPEGDSMLGMRAYFAREEHKRIRLRTVGTRKVLRDQGLYAEGLPPIGYKRSLPRGQKGIGKNVLREDPELAPVAREIFARCIHGESIGDIVQWLKRTRKERIWDKKQVGHLLRNRVYLGEVIDSKGGWIKGKHAGLIDAHTFERAQKALDGRRLAGGVPSQASRTNAWLLRQIAVCARCGAKIGAAYGGGTRAQATKEYVYYYRCTKSCGARYIPVKEQDDLVSVMLVERMQTIRGILSAPQRETAPEPSPEDFAGTRDKIQRRRERVLDLYTDGTMSRDEMQKSLRKIDAERLRVDAAEAEQVKRRKAVSPRAVGVLLEMIEGLRFAWLRANPSRRREILASLARVVRIARGAAPVVEWFAVEELASEIRD